MTDESDDFLKVVVRVLVAVEQTKVTEYLLLYLNEHTSDDLLPKDCIAFQTVGHYIIYVLDEDNVALEVVEILDECAVTARAEEELAVARAEGCVVHVDGDGVCAWLLLAQAHMICDFILVLCFGQNAVDELLKQFPVLRAERGR